MSEYKRYRRTQIAEMADWVPGMDVTHVSISGADLLAGSPKVGDKIARNPANHEDRWLVAADYFAVNFAPLDAKDDADEQIDRLANFIMAEVPGEPSESQGAVDTAIRWMRAALEVDDD